MELNVQLVTKSSSYILLVLTSYVHVKTLLISIPPKINVYLVQLLVKHVLKLHPFYVYHVILVGLYQPTLVLVCLTIMKMEQSVLPAITPAKHVMDR